MMRMSRPQSIADLIGSPYDNIKSDRLVMTPPAEARRRRLADSVVPPTPEPIPELPAGFTDVLRAEIVCKDEASMMAALFAMFAEHPSSKEGEHSSSKERPASNSTTGGLGAAQRAPASTDGKGNVVVLSTKGRGDAINDFAVVQVMSDFHLPHGKVFPRCAGIKLLVRIGTDKLVRGEELRQMVEVELVFPTTQEARFLAKTIGSDPAETPPPDLRFIKAKQKKKINYG